MHNNIWGVFTQAILGLTLSETLKIIYIFVKIDNFELSSLLYTWHGGWSKR